MNPTTSSRRLGQLLAQMRVAAGLTVRQVATEVGYTYAKVNQQEHGVRPVSVSELAFLVTRLYGGSEEDLRSLEYLRRKSEEPPGWWTETGANIVEHFQVYLGLEADAELVQTMALEVIPGLLQTEDYVRRQVDMATNIARDLRERYVAIRLRRQQRIIDTVDPLKLEVVLSEAALRRCEPKSDQLDGLIERAQLPTVRIRVLPFRTGIHRIAGSFSILTLPDGTLPPVVYQGSAVGGHIIEDRPSVEEITESYNELLSKTLDRASSLDFIREVGKN